MNKSWLEKLAHEFAELYGSKADSRRVAKKADLNTTVISFNDRAITNWHNIFTGAQEQKKVNELLEVGITEFSGVESLLQLRDEINGMSIYQDAHSVDLVDQAIREPREYFPIRVIIQLFIILATILVYVLFPNNLILILLLIFFFIIIVLLMALWDWFILGRPLNSKDFDKRIVQLKIDYSYFYRTLIRRVLFTFSQGFGPPNYASLDHTPTQSGTLSAISSMMTSRSFNRVLLISTVYPVVSILIHWFAGNAAFFGDEPILHPAENVAHIVILPAILLFSTACYVFGSKNSKQPLALYFLSAAAISLFVYLFYTYTFRAIIVAEGSTDTQTLANNNAVLLASLFAMTIVGGTWGRRIHRNSFQSAAFIVLIIYCTLLLLLFIDKETVLWCETATNAVCIQFSGGNEIRVKFMSPDTIFPIKLVVAAVLFMFAIGLTLSLWFVRNILSHPSTNGFGISIVAFTLIITTTYSFSTSNGPEYSMFIDATAFTVALVFTTSTLLGIFTYQMMIYIRRFSSTGIATVVIYFAFLVPIALTCIWLGKHNATSPGLIKTFLFIFLLLYVLPLINAPIDWISLAVTRGLLVGLKDGNYSVPKCMVIAFLDIALAFIFLSFVLVSLLTSVYFLASFYEIGSGSEIGNLNHIVGFMDIENILCQLRGPWTSSMWLWLMFATTLIPTSIHLFVSLLSIITVITIKNSEQLESILNEFSNRARAYNKDGNHYNYNDHKPSDSILEVIVKMHATPLVFITIWLAMSIGMGIIIFRYAPSVAAMTIDLFWNSDTNCMHK